MMSRSDNSGGSAYDYYVVAIFAVAYMLSFMDRVLISLLIGPIKAEFALSDTQIGALVGFGFVIFYSVLGVPFGALADRANRRNLILAGLLAWSAATSFSGLAGGFAMLVAMRAVVGVGEATLSPSAYSTIADRFPPERLGLAVALYGTGVSVGSGLAMMFGGVLVEWAMTATMTLPGLGQLGGWRLAMIVVGSLGLPLALLMALTVREAPRKVQAASPPMSELWRYVADRPRAVIGALTAFSFANVSNYVVYLWAPALFMRVHGLDARTTGLAFGAIVILFGSVGMIGSGIIADRLARRGTRDAAIRINICSLALQILIMPAAFMAGDPRLALALIVPALILMTAATSVQATALQLLTPPRMRGRMIAIYLLAMALVGMGLGPLAIGLLSDLVFMHAGGLAPAMAITAAVGAAIALAILLAVRRQVRDTIDELADPSSNWKRSA